MSYRNWERQDRREETVDEIRAGDGEGYIMVYKERKPVKMNRRKIMVHYDEEKEMRKEPAFTVYYQDGDGRMNEQLTYRDKEEAKEMAKGMIKDVTSSPQYRAELSEKLEFELLESSIAEKDEVAKSTTIQWGSSNRTSVIEEYFHSDPDYVMESVEEAGAYSEAVGQGLRARVRAK